MDYWPPDLPSFLTDAAFGHALDWPPVAVVRFRRTAALVLPAGMKVGKGLSGHVPRAVSRPAPAPVPASRRQRSCSACRLPPLPTRPPNPQAAAAAPIPARLPPRRPRVAAPTASSAAAPAPASRNRSVGFSCTIAASAGIAAPPFRPPALAAAPRAGTRTGRPIAPASSASATSGEKPASVCAVETTGPSKARPAARTALPPAVRPMAPVWSASVGRPTARFASNAA